MPDHIPIVCQFDCESDNLKIPFKFNYYWLKEAKFKYLVLQVWKREDEYLHLSTMDKMSKKLKSLKEEEIKWEKIRWDSAKKDLIKIEANIESIINETPLDSFRQLDVDMLASLEQEKLRILKLK